MTTDLTAVRNAVVARTGALGSTGNIRQTGYSRLLSDDNIVRIGGDQGTVTLELDTTGGMGAAMWVGSNDMLYVNHDTTFSQGTTVNGPLYQTSGLPTAQCHNDWGSPADTVNAMRYAECHAGEYVNAIACRINGYDGIGAGRMQCVARCCPVTNAWPSGPNPGPGTDF